MALHFHQFAYRSDNYGVLIHEDETGETACIDAGDAQATFQALDEKGWKLSELWITHHHADHTSHIGEIIEKTGAHVIGPDYGSKIAGVNQAIKEGDIFEFAGHKITPIHTPGHTMDMFVMGCGRLFEGSSEVMWQSLQKLMGLPPETMIYCAHEYTIANAAFALSVDPKNEDLQNRSELVTAIRAADQSTVPTMLSIELATNPFLRIGNEKIREHLGMVDASDTEVFTEIRKRKDNF
jgi:hydroxyacylglutathione hydrolase